MSRPSPLATVLASATPMMFVLVAACSARRAPEGAPSPAASADTLVAVRGGRIIVERGAARPGEIQLADSVLMAQAVSLRAEPASITMWVGDTIPVRNIRLIVLDANGTPLGFLGAMRDVHLQPGAAALVRGAASVSRGVASDSRGAAEGAAVAGGEVGGMSIKANSAGESVLELRVPRVLWMGRAEPVPVAAVRISVLAERSP